MRDLFIAVAMLLCAACTAQPKPEASLYQRIGGMPMLTRLSNQTLDIVSKDQRTKRSFEDVKMKTLKESVANFLCIKTGGD